MGDEGESVVNGPAGQRPGVPMEDMETSCLPFDIVWTHFDTSRPASNPNQASVQSVAYRSLMPKKYMAHLLHMMRHV